MVVGAMLSTQQQAAPDTLLPLLYFLLMSMPSHDEHAPSSWAAAGRCAAGGVLACALLRQDSQHNTAAAVDRCKWRPRAQLGVEKSLSPLRPPPPVRPFPTTRSPSWRGCRSPARRLFLLCTLSDDRSTRHHCAETAARAFRSASACAIAFLSAAPARLSISSASDSAVLETDSLFAFA